MGSWNGTCMLSNLPIVYDEAVKLVFLKSGNESIFRAGFCYPNDLLQPVLLPVSGRYDDYGCVKDCVEDWNYKIIEEHFKKTFANGLIVDRKETEPSFKSVIFGIERGKMQCKIEHFDPTESNFLKMMRDSADPEELQELENLANMPNANGWYMANLSFTLIRQDVWDACVLHKGKEIGTFYPRDRFRGQMTFLSYYQQVFDDYIEYLKEKQDEEPSIKQVLSRFTKVWNKAGESAVKFVTDEYANLCVEMINDETILQDIKKQWVEFSLIQLIIQDLRKSWMIQSGAGSSNTGYQNHKFFGELIAEIAENKLSQLED